LAGILGTGRTAFGSILKGGNKGKPWGATTVTLKKIDIVYHLTVRKEGGKGKFYQDQGGGGGEKEPSHTLHN